MSKFLTARLVSQDLVDYLTANEGRNAKVHSVYKHAINLLADDGAFITLATPEIAIMPMGIIVEGAVDSGWPINVGDCISLYQTKLMLNDSIQLVVLEVAEIWDPNPMLDGKLKSGQALVQVRNKLVDWLTIQPRIGLLPLITRLIAHSDNEVYELSDTYSRYIANDLIRFVEDLSNLDWRTALATARKLVGFGIGSTPSCDDFLASYLAILFLSQTIEAERFAWVSEFNRGVVDLAKIRTTTISAHMLEHAASSKLSRSHQLLIHACLFETEFDFFELVNEVRDTGASSGTDFLLGLSCALDWFIDHLIMNPAKGGKEQVGPQQVLPVTII